MSGTVRTEGSAATDREEVVTIDLEDATERWRYTCPHGHRNWKPTNGVWCRSCARDPDVDDPHHRELVDQVTDRTVPWSAIKLGGDPDE